MALQTFTSHTKSRAALIGACALGLSATGIVFAAGANATPDSFSPTGSMSTPRVGATAELAANGKVLVAGGQTLAATLNSTSVYDAATGTFAIGPTMTTPRTGAISAPLSNGHILVAGGFVGPSAGSYAYSTQLYNATTNSFVSGGDVAVGTVDPTSVTLADGRVLATGGTNGGISTLSSSQTFDLTSGVNGAWTTRGSMTIPRVNHTATRLASGYVLVAGGQASSTTYSSAELFNPTSNTFSSTTGSMAAARTGATASLLPNGKVLIAGGQGPSGYLNGTELYDPTSGTFSSGPSMSASRAFATATTLSSGRVLVAGGQDTSAYLSTSEIYDPATNLFSAGPALSVQRSRATETLLNNGKVLLVGGYGAGSAILSSADLFTPAAADAPVAQTPVGCSAMPKKLKRTGNSVVLKTRCSTNAGQAVRLSVKRISKKKGTYKVRRTSAGKVTIRTKNARGLKLRVTRSAPATPGYSGYVKAKTYTIK